MVLYLFHTTLKSQEYSSLDFWALTFRYCLHWYYLSCWSTFSMLSSCTETRWGSFAFLYNDSIYMCCIFPCWWWCNDISFQFLNVYVTKYESGGKLWPTAHKTIIVSLVLMQVIALGVFGIKGSSVAIGFTIPLIVGTILFHEYCRQRFNPIFKYNAAEVYAYIKWTSSSSSSFYLMH